jgi:MerR family transcriptional regulator, global nitrogen regulator
VKDVKTLEENKVQTNGEVHPYRHKKVITIGVVSELTGLSERQIRYYEERKLIFPERTSGGTRKYSFHDVDRLVDIANKLEDGLHTFEIRTMEKKQMIDKIHKHMIKGQLKSAFYKNYNIL